MTEAEWLACTELAPMLAFVKPTASERKLRLFAVACCRRIDRLITDPRCREALQFAERHVDVGVVGRRGRVKIVREARKAHTEAYQKMTAAPTLEARAKGLVVLNALDAAAQPLNTDASLAASYAASFSSYAVSWGSQVASGEGPYSELRWSSKRPEEVEQARLLRELFGNPFRPSAINPTWLAWNDGTAVKVAQGIYDGRAFERLPVLADALEEAGCTDADILSHCRGEGPHVRGCWAVDLILGKR